MNSVKPATYKVKNPKSPDKRKQTKNRFSDKISLIQTLILGSVESDIIKKIYLFGSYAYGKPTKNSDIDLCIIINNNQDDSEIYLKIARSLFLNSISPIDILLYKENEFIDFSKSDGIENLIFTKGKILYG